MQRWRIAVELTYDIKPEDNEIKYEDDTETDFAFRSLERVRPDLDMMLVFGDKFAHYHILEMPKRCEDA